MQDSESNFTLNEILRDGAIIDNKRIYDGHQIKLKDVVRLLSRDSDALKCAVGYFYIEGLALIIEDLKELTEIKILMGGETTKLTKSELISAFKDKFNQVMEDKRNISAVLLFRRLVKEAKTLKVRAYFGDSEHIEKLHSKAYLFLANSSSNSLLQRYFAGIIGSSNLTPSGLINNTELNIIISTPKDLEYLEGWFDDLWDRGSVDFERLTIADAIVQGIDQSKFGPYVEEGYHYLSPRVFFTALVKFLEADYLLGDWTEPTLLQFQRIDVYRCLQIFRERGYRGVLLTSSVGLGKSYVAAQVAQYYLREGKKVLLIGPAGLIRSEEQWPAYLKEFEIYEQVDRVSMGKLQVRPESLDERLYAKDYGFIIVDEAHNYRNQDAQRTRNLKRIIDLNGNAKILFLTATPINTRLSDLLNLIKLFHRKKHNQNFDKLVRDLSGILDSLKGKDYIDLTRQEKEKLTEVQDEIEKELFVKSTRETIKTSEQLTCEVKERFGVNIRDLPDPDVQEIIYTLDRKYQPAIEGIVEFINDFSAAHLRVLDPEKGSRLSGFFKWILYKRFESDITSYYLTLKRLLFKDEMILDAIENKNMRLLKGGRLDDTAEDDIDFYLGYDFKLFQEKLRGIIEEINRGEGIDHLSVLGELKSDIIRIKQELANIERYRKEGSRILFIDDQKLTTLLNAIRSRPDKKIIIFTEYADTLNAINEFMSGRVASGSIAFIDSSTEGRDRIIKRFNSPEDDLRILITTDVLSEGYNMSGADVVINFDIPFNPVRLIQRVGRSTRLNTLKKIQVLNFRPDASIDKELKLVDTLQIRIEDIINWVGIEYRIWFDKEKRLLKKKRKRDRKFYLEILKNIRQEEWAGEYKEGGVPIQYARQAWLRNALLRYKITREDIDQARIPSKNVYTLLNGQTNLVVFYDKARSFNESSIASTALEECERVALFESQFANQLEQLNEHLQAQKEEQTRLQYLTDPLDTSISSIQDWIITHHLDQQVLCIKELLRVLKQVRYKCGSTTERTVNEIKTRIKQPDITEEKVLSWVDRLESSFTKREIQQKLNQTDGNYEENVGPYFAIGFIPC